jgi:protein SCO1/2
VDRRTCLLGLILAFAGCGRERAPVKTPKATQAAPAKRPKSYPLKGVVRKIDRETGVVQVRHEEIVGFMPAMTMPFVLKGQPVLEDLEVGDEITGTLDLSGDDSTLTNIQVTHPATPSVAVEVPSVAVLKPGEFVPDFEMTTEEGKKVSLSALRGKVVVLTFIYTRCPLPNFCPLMDKKFSKLADMLAKSPQRAERTQLLSLSFDPEHDVPETLKAHAATIGAKRPLWLFAVADHPELSKVGPRLGLMYGPGENEILHSLSTAVIDPEGRLAWLDRGNEWTPEEVFKVVAFLTKSTKR